jgi:threonine synthase
MWRYIELLPVKFDRNIISLGEGATKMIKTKSLAKMIGLKSLYMKDEGSNPTGSFKSRGLSMAVSKAKELGIQKISIPTAGNAGSALSAYCAAAGIEAKIYMPKETPDVFKIDCEVAGATVNMIDGDISACAMEMQNDKNHADWFDVSTMKEPYRLEGKKTMGFEIAEYFKWKLPDVILYPTGGGTGLIGIWKAFKELKRMGWIKHIKTRMVAVQVTGCAPIVKAFKRGKFTCTALAKPVKTIANGLRVPKVFADRLVMSTLYESHGTALTVTDREIYKSVNEIARKEGIFVSPEGAAVWAALKKLTKKNWIKPHEKVVMLNTGSAYKYIENMVNYAKKLKKPPQS